jgi:hypothetical protein
MLFSPLAQLQKTNKIEKQKNIATPIIPKAPKLRIEIA